MVEIVAAVAAVAASSATAAGLGTIVIAGLPLGLSFGTAALVIGGASALVGGIAASAVSGFLSSRGNTPNFTQTATARSLIVRSNIESHKVIYGRARVSGPLAFVGTTDTGRIKNESGSFSESTATNQFLHLVIPVAAHEIEEFETVILNEVSLTLDADGFATNEEFTRDNGTLLVRVNTHFGSDDQLADPDLVQEVSEWSSDHRLRGLAYLYVRLQYSQQEFPNGIPQIRAVVKGKKVFDPRTDTTAYSDNWALCVRDYLTNVRYGFGATDSEIDDDFVIAAANESEEQITLFDGSTQIDRYTCNGLIDTAGRRRDNLKELLSSAVGALTYSGGVYRIHAASYQTPSLTVTQDWLAGDVSVQARPPKSELYNAIKGVYVDPEQEWQPTDFPVVENTTYQEQDGGLQLFTELELPFVINGEYAQRIARIALEKSRQGIIVELELNDKGLQLEVWDTFYLTLADFGWDQKVFRVLSWQLGDGGAIALQAQEESSASYDWNGGDATVNDPAPDTNLPDARTVESPGRPVVTEELYNTIAGGSIKSRAVLTWSESPDAFLRQYRVESRVNGTTDWQFEGTPPQNNLTIYDLDPAIYDFRVRAENTVGRVSIWQTTMQELFGLTAPPEDVMGFAHNVVNGLSKLSWNRPNPSIDLDVIQGGQFVIKYSPATSGVTWSTALTVWPEIPGDATDFVLENLASGTFLIKAVDSSGNESINATAVVTNVADIIKLNALATLTESPDFTGSKTNLVASGGTLQLDGAGMFDAVAGNFDDAQGLFDSGNGTLFETTATYEFSQPIDAGRVVEAKLTSRVDGLVFDATDTFDERAGLFDAQSGRFDGDDVGDVVVTFFVRTTDDDPNGSPVWGDYEEFTTGDFEARGFDFKIEIESENASLNIAIDDLAVSADLPDIIEQDTFTTSGSGADSVTYTVSFQSEPEIGITIQDGQPGDYYEITNDDQDGFDIEVFNIGFETVARTISYIAKGV